MAGFFWVHIDNFTLFVLKVSHPPVNASLEGLLTMAITFTAEIIEVKVKKLASGDKSYRIILETNAENHLIYRLS